MHHRNKDLYLFMSAFEDMCCLAAEEAKVVDTQGGSRLNSLHHDCNWTLNYGERYKLIFYGMPEQIKP